MKPMKLKTFESMPDVLKNVEFFQNGQGTKQVLV